MSKINIIIGENNYVKDPLSSELGKRILRESIIMLDELGYEQFTFKKLALKIKSTEASIYRYFENKLRLLIYLTTWYWAWVEYRIDYDTHHLSDGKKKLSRIWEIVCHVNIDSTTELPLDLTLLRNIVVSESDKTYLTKQVDEINKEGLFRSFKELCHKIAQEIVAVNPNYAHPHTLVSTMLDSAHQQPFFANHLPSLTEIRSQPEKSVNVQVYEFIDDSVMKLISQ
jgi:AcrR family transcriptional regulator